MSDKATPRPWKYDEKLPTSIWSATDYWIGSTNVENVENYDERAANAELIVRAVNAHDVLVEALEELLGVVNESEGIAGWHLNGDVLGWDKCEFIHKAVVALALARGE